MHADSLLRALWPQDRPFKASQNAPKVTDCASLPRIAGCHRGAFRRNQTRERESSGGLAPSIALAAARVRFVAARALRDTQATPARQLHALSFLNFCPFNSCCASFV